MLIPAVDSTTYVIDSSHHVDRNAANTLQCADITFTSTSPEQPSSCTNGTGISASPLAANAYTFANETAPHEGGHGDGEPSATESGAASSATGEAAASASADAASMMSAGLGALGAAVLGAVALI